MVTHQNMYHKILRKCYNTNDNVFKEANQWEVLARQGENPRKEELQGMKEDLFHIGPLTVHSYGLMIAIGVWVAFWMVEKRAKRYQLNDELVFSLGMWCLLGGMLGAKLLYFIIEIEDILANPDILNRLVDGFVVYGGIIGGVLAGYLFCKVKKLKFLKYFDLVMPSIAIAQGFGRIGCFLAGCCYGRETDSPFGIVFHESRYAPNGVPLIPTQLISSAADFIHCLILVWFARRAKKDGQVGALYLILYSIGRALIEMLRNDPRGAVSTLSTSQFISIFILLGGVALFVWTTKQKENPKEV